MNTAIVDYEMCNMFSVKQAADHAGLHAEITSDHERIRAADLIILPGVGAFGDAMQAIRRLKLDKLLHELAEKGKLLLGICLGFQLFMTSSEEFGFHDGLNLIPGKVKRFQPRPEAGTEGTVMVPHVGWSSIWKAESGPGMEDPWGDTPLQGIAEGEYFYFVHSYYVEPARRETVLSWTSYGPYRFCSSLRQRNIFAFQYHPEKSGPAGMQIYKNLLRTIQTKTSLNL